MASAFLKDGRIVSLRGRGVAPEVLNATGDTVAPKTRWSSSSTATRRRRRRSSPARCRTTTARRSSGTRTFGKGVFQEVIELDNGGALDITAGQYFTPDGRNLGGGGVKPGAGIQPDVKAVDNPKTTARRGAEPRAADARGRSPVRGRTVAVLEKRGRFLVGIPFFPRHGGDRHRSIAVDRDRNARPGALVVLRSGSGPGEDRARPGQARRRARRHRGADDRPRAGAALPAGRRAGGTRGQRNRRAPATARTSATCRRSRSTRSRRRTSTTRSRPSSSSPSAGASGCTSPTSAPT